MKVTLNEQFLEKFEKIKVQFKVQFKDRELQTKDWNCVMNTILFGISEKDWTKAIEENTPDEWYIKMALSDSNERKSIVEIIKKKKRVCGISEGGVKTHLMICLMKHLMLVE